MNPHRCLSFARVALIFFAAMGVALGAGSWGDRPLKIVQTFVTDFPPTLAAQGVTSGQVRAVVNVDADGQFVDCLVTAYTDPELARDVLANLREWHYEAAHAHGEPIGVRADVIFTYEVHGAVLSMVGGDATTALLTRLMGTKATSILCKPADLDHPLAAVQVIRPMHPGGRLVPVRPTGSVVLDYFVDADGRPRMPVVVQSTHDAFAVAAVDALTQWRFAPPTRDGKPVVVRVRQEFVFSDRS